MLLTKFFKYKLLVVTSHAQQKLQWFFLVVSAAVKLKAAGETEDSTLAYHQNSW